jgi:RNA polymerase sigma-70 factor (ECF subfamily)
MGTAENSEPRVSEIVCAIQAGCPDAQEQLYDLLSRGMRILISRRLAPQDVDDVLHTSFIAVVAAIRSNRIDRPEALIGYARTIVNRQIFAAIGSYVRGRTQETADASHIDLPVYSTPELDYIDDERREHVRKCIEQLRPMDREILYRFYVLEQSKEEICHDLKLTETAFRLAKSRAKAKLVHKTAAKKTILARFLSGRTARAFAAA